MPREPIRRPLSPEALLRLGVIHWDDLVAREGRGPSKSARYEIWGFHGYVESGNRSVGTLALESAPEDGQPTEIRVLQEVRNVGGFVERTTASLVLGRQNRWAPAQWRVERRLLDPRGREIGDTRYQTSGRAGDGRIEILEQGEKRNLVVSRSWMCDWCPFAGIPISATLPGNELDLFEQLSAWKGPYRLFVRGEQPVSWEGRTTRLRRVDLIGQGNLPFEFWLRKEGELALVLSGDKAFVRRWDE